MYRFCIVDQVFFAFLWPNIMDFSGSAFLPGLHPAYLIIANLFDTQLILAERGCAVDTPQH